MYASYPNLAGPAGGPAYLQNSVDPAGGYQRSKYTLDTLAPLSGADLIAVCRAIVARTVLFLPRNLDVEELSQITAETDRACRPGPTVVEVEEAWTGKADNVRVKACTVYLD